MIKKQINAAIRHPHHYANALFLTVCAWAFGELKFTVVAFFWLYALGENFSTDEALNKAIRLCLDGVSGYFIRGNRYVQVDKGASGQNEQDQSELAQGDER
jgi:hypothetical protein